MIKKYTFQTHKCQQNSQKAPFALYYPVMYNDLSIIEIKLAFQLKKKVHVSSPETAGTDVGLRWLMHRSSVLVFAFGALYLLSRCTSLFLFIISSLPNAPQFPKESLIG